ncbi:putative fatty acid desaturase, partial [Rosellinia necatrix]
MTLNQRLHDTHLLVPELTSRPLCLRLVAHYCLLSLETRRELLVPRCGANDIGWDFTRRPPASSHPHCATEYSFTLRIPNLLNQPVWP